MLFRTIDNASNPDAAMEMMRHVLAENDFQISSEGSTTVTGEFKGNISSKIPIRLATPMGLHSRGGRLELEVEFGGVRRMGIFLVTFIGGMSVMFMLIFGAVFSQQASEMGGFGFLTILGPFAPWPFLIPIMLKTFKRRAVTAVDTLANNLAEASGGRVSIPTEAPTPSRSMGMVVFGVVVMAIGVPSALFLVPAGAGSMTKNEILFTVPGEHALEFSEPGVYTIFHKFRTQYKGKIYDVDHELRGLQLKLTSQSSGETIPIESVSPTSNYSNDFSSPKRAGYSAFRFTAPEAGAYSVVGAYPPGREKSESVLSVVRFNVGRLGWSTFRILLLVSAPLVGILSIVSGLSGKSRSNVR